MPDNPSSLGEAVYTLHTCYSRAPHAAISSQELQTHMTMPQEASRAPLLQVLPPRNAHNVT